MWHSSYHISSYQVNFVFVLILLEEFLISQVCLLNWKVFYKLRGGEGKYFSKMWIHFDHGSPVFLHDLRDAGESGVICDGQDWPVTLFLRNWRFSYGHISGDLFCFVYCCVNERDVF